MSANNSILETFLGYTATLLAANGKTLHLVYADLVEGGSSGYYDGEVLAVATKRSLEDWLGILVHEVCHFMQEQDLDQGVDVDYTTMPDEDYGTMFEAIRSVDNPEPIEMEQSRFVSLCESTQAMESDCDRRAVQMIKDFNLPIDLEAYCRASNAYMLFHEFMCKHRVWYDVAPYRIPALMALMDTELMDPGTWIMDAKLEQLFRNHCFHNWIEKPKIQSVSNPLGVQGAKIDLMLIDDSPNRVADELDSDPNNPERTPQSW